MAVTPPIVVTLCAISYCLFSRIPALEAKDITVSFQLNASTKDHLRLDADARFVSGTIFQLTNGTKGLYETDGSAGRVVYPELIPLWNNSTKAVANFTTYFQFQINWTNQSTPDNYDFSGGGLAFFMASEDSGYHVPYGGEYGLLGLFPHENNGDETDLVAVEFDTFVDEWDPDCSHVGIDLNKINSADYVSLELNDGKIWDARIDYHGQDNMLNVSVSCRLCNGRGPWILSLKINLTEYLPEDIVVGFSAASMDSSEIHRLISWNFTSTIPTSTTLNPLSKKKKITSEVVVIIVSVSCLVTVILVCFVIHFLYTRRKRLTSEEQQSDVHMVLDHVPREFPYAELSAGTNNFSEKEKLGQGGFGDVYKGILVKSNEVVAVKRISAGSQQGKKEYAAEITTITRLRHRNLVQLLGWCHEKSQLLLVYEYMPNGSLDNFLFGKRRGDLDWTRRYRIASDIASALFYLHELWDECVVHRDVKSSNVMLDSEFNAKLGDFGLARLVKHDQWFQTSTIAGTLGYLAPECAVTGISSAESDVFSFGAVALEIACGRPALDLRLEKHKMRLLEWVWDLYGQGRLLDAVDSSLNGEFDRIEMEMLVVIGLWCSHPDPLTRPKIRQVLQLINFELPMPNLPNTLPQAAFSPIQAGFFSEMSDFPPADVNSQEMAVFSRSASRDMPSTSGQVLASTGSSTAMSKSSVVHHQP